MATLTDLAELVESGKSKEVRSLTQKLLGENVSADAIITEGVIAGLDALGKKFEKFEAFVPELITAGLAAQEALKVLRPKMTQKALHKEIGTVVIGTVEGDVHDVGKNIVAMMLEGGGFKVIDLGVDVPPDTFIKEAKYHGADILALSALYSPTRLAMKETLQKLIDEGMRDNTKVMVGGAPIDQEFCDLIGADGYAPDAPAGLKLAKTFVK
ncbi:MAG: corrinoid protein, partial [Deltaproteobacteria bacterium]